MQAFRSIFLFRSYDIVMNTIKKTLKELEIEDIIWIITLFSAIWAIVSNQFERNYVLTKNKKSKADAKTINVTLLTISFLVYIYFLFLSYSRVKQINPNTTFKQARLTNLNFYGAILFVTAALISIFVEIFSDDGSDTSLTPF